MATPKKKSKEWPPAGVDPKPNPSKGIKGSGAIVKRVDGDLKSIKPKDFAGVSNKTLKEDAKTKAGTGDGTYKGGPAPRVGGKQKMVGKSGPLKSASKKIIRQSRRKPTGSPAARKSQRRNRR